MNWYMSCRERVWDSEVHLKSADEIIYWNILVAGVFACGPSLNEAISLQRTEFAR